MFVRHRDTGRMLDGDPGFRAFSVVPMKESEPGLGSDAESHSKLVLTCSSMACVIARKLNMMRDVAIEVLERMMLVVLRSLSYQETKKRHDETHGQYIAGMFN